MSALCDQMTALCGLAARAGMADVPSLPDLTPRELSWAIESCLSRRQDSLEMIDLGAWLIGRYVMTALYNPRKYPKSPDGIRRRREAMTDDEMKDVFLSMAKEGCR